jgi:hypothetical protein
MSAIIEKESDYEEGDYDWMRSCYDYCGEFSKNMSLDDLQDILAKGLVNVVKHMRELNIKNPEDKIDQLMCLLDIWIEHDENGANKFAHVICWNDDEEVYFFKGIEEKIYKLDSTLMYSDEHIERLILDQSN